LREGEKQPLFFPPFLEKKKKGKKKEEKEKRQLKYFSPRKDSWL